jgi:DtxR family Mn-dependent transcriptional regulator
MPEEMTRQSDASPELPGTTESEQMYLITVARAAEEGASGPLPVAALAAALGVSVVSANEKVHRLVERGLLEYSPYKGVELTGVGGDIARRVLRTRRLWSTFLTEHLGYSPGEADALACRLEHATPPPAAERLAAYLGDPRTGPLGKPIPPGVGGEGGPSGIPLTEVPVGGTAEILSVAADPEQARFLAAESLVPGTVVTVRGAGSSGVLLEAGGRRVHLAAGLARLVEAREERPHVAG